MERPVLIAEWKGRRARGGLIRPCSVSCKSRFLMIDGRHERRRPISCPYGTGRFGSKVDLQDPKAPITWKSNPSWNERGPKTPSIRDSTRWNGPIMKFSSCRSNSRSIRSMPSTSFDKTRGFEPAGRPRGSIRTDVSESVEHRREFRPNQDVEVKASLQDRRNHKSGGWLAVDEAMKKT